MYIVTDCCMRHERCTLATEFRISEWNTCWAATTHCSICHYAPTLSIHTYERVTSEWCVNIGWWLVPASSLESYAIHEQS